MCAFAACTMWQKALEQILHKPKHKEHTLYDDDSLCSTLDYGSFSRLK